jgi:arginase family enzyme
MISPSIVFPVPYDYTATWQKGADLGPKAIIEASAHVELYDIETDSEVHLLTKETEVFQGQPSKRPVHGVR